MDALGIPLLRGTAQIRKGKSNRRNPTLTDHAVKILPYRGIGTGIPRVLEAWPETRLLDDVDGNEFKAVIPRPVNSVTPEVARLLAVLQGEMSRDQIMTLLGLRDEKHFRVHYQQAAVAPGLIEMTLQDKPRSSNQRSRLTALGRQWLKKHA